MDSSRGVLKKTTRWNSAVHLSQISKRLLFYNNPIRNVELLKRVREIVEIVKRGGGWMDGWMADARVGMGRDSTLPP